MFLAALAHSRSQPQLHREPTPSLRHCRDTDPVPLWKADFRRLRDEYHHALSQTLQQRREDRLEVRDDDDNEKKEEEEQKAEEEEKERENDMGGGWFPGRKRR